MGTIGTLRASLSSTESDESLLPFFGRGRKLQNRPQLAEPASTKYETSPPENADASSAREMAAKKGSGFQLLVCFAGLQASYLTWGYFQERIMTQKYSNDSMFPSSVFLVFGNRMLALTVALAVVYLRRERGEGASVETKQMQMSDVLTFVPCSFSNVLSSWAQYECLKYISFPMQVCTIITIL